MKLLLRRAIAFLVDANVYLMLWGVVDNLVAIPVPEGVLELVKGAGFALYLAAFAAVSADAPSLGLRLTRLRIVSADGTPLTRKRVVLRGLILGGMLLTGWHVVVRDVFWIGLPWWAAYLLMAIPRGIFLAGVASALLDRSGRLPHDRKTRTRVMLESEAEEEVSATEAVPPRLPAAGRLGIGIALVAASFFLFVQTALVQQKGQIPLTDPMIDHRQIGPSVVSLFRERLLLRSRVEFGRNAHAMGVRIWLPWVAMNAETMDQGVQTFFQNLTLDNGFCDTVFVTFWTGQRSTRLAMVKPIPIPLLPDDRAIGGGSDTVCVPVPMPPDAFEASIGPDLYEPITNQHADLGRSFAWRLLRTEGSPPGLIKLTPPYTMTVCVHLVRPGVKSISQVVTTRKRLRAG